MKKYNTLLSLALVLLLASCSSVNNAPTLPKQPDKIPIGNASVILNGSSATDSQPIKENKSADKAEPKYDEEVGKLINKSKSSGAYSYSFKSRIRNKYKTYDETNYNAYIKNNKIKKVFSDIKETTGKMPYNEVYLDSIGKTAYGVCALSGVSCQNYKQFAYKLDYDSERLVITPLELIQNVGYDARKVGEEMFDSRKTTIIGYDNQYGEKEKLFVDNYFGLPLKQVAYKYEDDNEIVIKQNTFTSLSVSVKNADVTLPASYTIQE